MWLLLSLVTFSCAVTLLSGQSAGQNASLHNNFSERIGNFSLEMLYFTAKAQPTNQNLVIAPITLWTVLAVMDEGATGNTSAQLRHVARLGGHKNDLRSNFSSIAQYLMANTSTVQLEHISCIFVDQNNQMERDFKEVVTRHYNTKVAELNFYKPEPTAKAINEKVSQITHGRIKQLVSPSDFDQAKMLLMSALYFKGQWTAPFNASSTEKDRPFHDSMGKVIGTVNMMYNRYTYPFANIKELEARVIELPYGKENRLSMLIMLPNPYVSLESMFLKFLHVPLDRVFEELKISQSEYGEDEVDCLIPRFKIENTLDLNNVLQDMGIFDIFDPVKARFGGLARTPLHVTKVVHKAEIEVTEEGTTGSAVTAAEFANRIGIVRFEASRPFAYMIIEKVTNSIVFGGLYRQPSLY